MLLRPILAAVLLTLVASGSLAAPTNVIVMIADGMGPEHVEAARLYNGGPLSFESAPNQALMTTDSLTGVTDSAASATAMATGQKVTNFNISEEPDGTPMPTSLEILKGRGKSTGLVTTSYVEDATAAAFGAHAAIRFYYGDITDDYLNDSRPNLLLGAVQPGDQFLGTGIDPTKAANAGYAVAQTRAELLALGPGANTHVSGQFGTIEMGYEWDQAQGTIDHYDTVPYLSEMAAYSLDFLSQDPDGFFLMIEQENTDLAGHLPNTDPDKTARDIFATLEFADAVSVVLNWIGTQADPSETLLIVTADHETGGLDVVQDNGAGVLPTVTWQGSSHTGVPVGIYAWGENSELVSGVMDNTDIFTLTTLPEPGTAWLLLAGVVALALRSRAH